MFVNKEKLEYILKPHQYYSEEQYAIEMERLFIPGWHIVGIKSEFENPGDFRTTELLGEPLLIRNDDGNIQTYLNVCSHRHCLLTSEEKGNAPSLRCQYHGWEYQPNGHTAKIPEANCFRPFDRENAKLHLFRTEVCGEIVFASLAETGPTLKEYLGDFYDVLTNLCSVPLKLRWHWEVEFPCNWKFPVENTVETYHLAAVHESTFGNIYPPEEFSTHDLGEKHTTLKYDYTEDMNKDKFQKKVVKVIGGEQNYMFLQQHAYPNVVFTKTDVNLHAQVYLPVSPTTCKTRIWFFGTKSPQKGLLPRLAAWAAGKYGAKFNAKLQLEDKAIFDVMQKGIEATRFDGCIGTREERIYNFQQYIQRTCSDLLADDQTEDHSQNNEPINLPR